MLQVTSVLGDMVTDVVNVASPSGAVVGAAQFPFSAAYQTVGGTLLTAVLFPSCSFPRALSLVLFPSAKTL